MSRRVRSLDENYAALVRAARDENNARKQSWFLLGDLAGVTNASIANALGLALTDPRVAAEVEARKARKRRLLIAGGAVVGGLALLWFLKRS